MKNLIMRNNNRDYLGDFISDSFDSLFRPLFFDEKLDIMKTDISEDENNYALEIELPGYDKSDITVDYEKGYLTVRAEKSEKEGNSKPNYIRKERSVSCQRSFYVGEIDEDSITAKYDNGILTVTVPKQDKKQPVKKGINID